MTTYDRVDRSEAEEQMLAAAKDRAAKRSNVRAGDTRKTAIVLTVVTAVVVLAAFDFLPWVFNFFGLRPVGQLLSLALLALPVFVWFRLSRAPSQLHPDERGQA